MPKDPVATNHICFIVLALKPIISQDVVFVKLQSPINPITVFEIHVHVNHAPRQPRAPSYHARGGHLTHGEKFYTKLPLSSTSSWSWTHMATACDPWYCFIICSTTEFLVAGVLLTSTNHGQTVFEFHSEILTFRVAWRLQLTSYLANAYMATRSRFSVHPSQVTICNGKYIIFVNYFLSIVNSLFCRSQPCVDNRLSKSNCAFSIPHSSTLHSRYYYYNSLASSLWYVNGNKANIHLQ